jgi:hypothetical protein
MNNWKEERQKVFRRAETWHREIQAVKAALGVTYWEKAQEWANEDPEGRAVLREFAAILYDHLEELARFMEVKLVHGVVSFIEHAWFVVEGSPELVNPHSGAVGDLTDMNPARMNARGVWRYIVDPAALEVLPSCLLIAPTSPFQVYYRESSRYTEHPPAPVKPANLDEALAARERMIAELLGPDGHEGT